MKLVRSALVALAVAVALLAVPQGAHAARPIKAIWGPLELHDGSSALPVYRRLRVDVLQLQLHWADVAKARPAHPRDPHDRAYAWPKDLSHAIRVSHRYGLRIALMIIGAPRWANGGQPPNFSPTDPQDFADFAAAASRRYPRVRQWMIWGEPHRPGVFEPFDPQSHAGPERYARLLDASYAALKSVRRHNIVIGGMTFTNDAMTPVRFLNWMRLPNGRPPRLDWFGHNPFAVRFPDIRQGVYYPGVRDISDVDTYMREIRRTYRPIGLTPRLWLSEFTVQSDHSTPTFRYYVSRRAQARWLTAAYRLAAQHSYIAGLGWFELQDSDRRLTGLLDVHGRPKPAFYAYRRVP